ncbi:DUF6415 family natural product biosynthesis protein (plasmid) [Streptomyces sp. HUAS TT11]|uniref:DUF6415 family natural product biosynthesis protein n=1 Tax=Streptomyces sp. HUAS TT11 TaxID=3447508 RepID=UPI003F654D0B
MFSGRPLIDAAAIRQAYNAGFQVWVGGEEEQESVLVLRDRLEGHVTLLLPEVEDVTARMRGEWRRMGIHVLIRAHHVMNGNGGTSPQEQAVYVQDLAVMSRSLLALYEHAGPLGVPVGVDEIAAAVRRRVCASCCQEIREGEPHTQGVFASDSSGGVYGWLHSQGCSAAESLEAGSATTLHP